MKRVDINVDIGEGFSYDEALLEFATSANVCCGEHAGSRDLTLDTIAMCVRKGVRIGCHPGYPDREGFGRREPPDGQILNWHTSIRAQVVRFSASTKAHYVKPHGAWYAVVCSKGDSELFRVAWGTLCEIVVHDELPAMLMFGTDTALQWQGRGCCISEGFADRRYRDGGTLVARSEPGAVLEDPVEIAKQVLTLAPRVDSICVHGDTPNCLGIAELVKRTLIDAGYEVGY